MTSSERIAVVGLGYVGLPLAVAFARAHPDVLGFDVDDRRIQALREGRDRTGEVSAQDLRETTLRLTSEPEDLHGATAYFITVPTPVDETNRPDLSAVVRACETVGKALTPGAVVVLESTVYPGVTETVCAPALAAASGMEPGSAFRLAYSPERMNPGDAEHGLAQVVKVVSAEDQATLERVMEIYRPVAKGGLHAAASIRVAETAKIIENVQRDLNIALMNEVAIICDRLGIATRDVLDAAETKWNFLGFRPGLVGGHCVGVDPYYLTTRAELAGYHPQVILAGRRINDSMGAFIAQKTVTLLLQEGFAPADSVVHVLGVTFKANVPDIRNSRVPDIVSELERFGFGVRVFDPLADPEEVRKDLDLSLSGGPGAKDLATASGVVLAVPHRAFLDDVGEFLASLPAGAVVVDVQSAMDPARVPGHLRYWSL